MQPAVVAKNILLVTAHPDDEAMFFAPTILNLAEKASNESIGFAVVCLSNGNAEGLGETRTSELEKSFDVLGVVKSRRWIVDHPELQDNMTADWDRIIIAKVLEPYVLDLDIDTILTFDSQGISSHPNHKSIHRGVQTLIQNLGETSSKQPRRLYTLVSSSLAYKYISILSVTFGKVDVYGYRWMQMLENYIIEVLAIWYPEIMTPAIPRHPDGHAMPEFISGIEGYAKALEAMKMHDSQLVWFRWLYVAFSKYMWVNSWVQVSADAQ
ncbi:LmbE-like protein [Pholiota conissans]|uniref:N-acetylglucosaminylphosphatidylinositol deacetylase n=1 Tax=Pholiota conissans TaxID=109636 RepID=A0A9P5YWE9_9AGAR|nr:LmbE-like protein [Pholiota conissans]